MNWIRRAWFLIFTLILSHHIGAQSPLHQAVVSIQSYYATGPAQKATGFFISPDGSVLTCYHAINRATRITVHFQGESLPAIVARVAPKHDLAVLQVSLSSDVQVPALSLFDGSPSAAQRSELLVISHALGIESLETTARLTRPDWLPSELFRTPDGTRLFSAGTPVLILEARAIHEGMSGAPVLFNGRVLGVLSGSVSTGGDIAWAMNPHEAFGRDSRRYNIPPVRMPWPDFSLMRETQWRTLLRSSSATDERVAKVTEYVSKSQLERDLYLEHLTAVSRFSGEIDDLLSLANRALENNGTPSWLLEEIQRRIQTGASAVVTAGGAYWDADYDRFSAGQDLMKMAWDNVQSVPLTQGNAKVEEEFIRVTGALLMAADENSPGVDEMIARRDATSERRELLETSTSALFTSLPDLIDRLIELRSVAEEEWEHLLRLRDADELSRKLMAGIEKLLFLDSWSDPWVYRHPDYEIFFPPGWTLVSRDRTEPSVVSVVGQVSQWYDKRGGDLQDIVVSSQFESLWVCFGSYNSRSLLMGRPLDLAGGTTAYLEEHPTGWTFVRIPRDSGFLELAGVYDGNAIEQATVREQCVDIALRIHLRVGP